MGPDPLKFSSLRKSINWCTLKATVGLMIVGDEILDGVVPDTNGQRIINKLKPLNLRVREKFTVRDDVTEIAIALKRLMEDECEVICTTGGLGSTHDDKTLEGVADALDLSMVLDRSALEMVSRQYLHFLDVGLIDRGQMTDPRRRMAMLPEGSKPLDNRIGIAPGSLLKVGDVMIFSLPGVPEELDWILDNRVLPILIDLVEGFFYERIIRLPLRDESLLAPIIEETMEEFPRVYIKSIMEPYSEEGIKLWLSATGEDENGVKERVSHVAGVLKHKFGEDIGNPQDL